ncbi:phosphatase PAP2 family protein [Halovivax gelatinilyticus]|uniref:phosphatase PAP2 family protein n=1 Tax=Halovivax gelatinilyticus TaxID=2961597 RepID=UPI0020CA58CD|nr:phosphatase PAP2 family protein [Halovivax gelatinilyticus]
MVRDIVRETFWDESTNQAFRDTTPDPVVSALEVLTHLGDGAVIVGLAVLLYWFGATDRRRDRIFVIAVGLAGMAIVSGIKGIVALERPTAALAFAPVDYPGYTFPSAHALGTAVVYTALAAVATIGTARQRYAVAAVIIVLVAYSRVVMGVHYLGDVIVGVGLGLAFIALVIRDPDPEISVLFSLAGATAILAYLLGSTQFVTLTVGASIGGLAGWAYVKPRRPDPYGASILVLGVLVLGLFLALRWLQVLGALEWTVDALGSTLGVAPAIEVVGYALATAAAVAVPNAAERLDDWPAVQRLQAVLPFSGRTVDPEKVSLPGVDSEDDSVRS